MPSAPQSPYAQLYQKAQTLVVLLGDTNGNAPTLTGQVNWLIPQSLTITAGATRDDVINLKVDLAKLGKRLLDTTAPVAYQRQVEIRTLDSNNQPNNVLAWGFIAKNPQVIDGEQEGTSFEARIANFHFGNPLVGYPVWQTVAAQKLTVNRPLVFNPEIDETICGNMSSQEDPTNLWNYVIDPESLRTPASQAYQVQTASNWTLSEAVLFLCWLLNPNQTYIQNPIQADLQTVFSDRGSMIKNIEIRTGSFLSEALDQLLTPLEYGWYLQHSLYGGVRQTKIRIFSRGTGPLKQVLMQRPGQQRDIKKTNVASFEADYSINDLANQIMCYGDYLRREATFMLQKGWNSTYDNLTPAQLERGTPDAELHPEVGRKWILNEAADYNGERPELTGSSNPLSPYIFDTLFGQTQQIRRRRFLPCLTTHLDADDPESNRFRVDWYDKDQPGATSSSSPTDPGWVRVKWPFSVLEKECGILFESSGPPDPLMTLINNGHASQSLVRITATVAGDQKLSGIVNRPANSPNGLPVPLVIDLQDRFQMMKVDTSSIFYSRPSIARDDTTPITTYATEIQAIENACKIHCSILLEGIAHPEYQIGNLINQVTGRNLSLNALQPGAGVNPRNPQVVGFRYHLSGTQMQELLLDSFEAERPEIVHHNRKTEIA